MKMSVVPVFLCFDFIVLAKAAGAQGTDASIVVQARGIGENWIPEDAEGTPS
ncbi:hypothetical protein [Mesorhizobium amorphae]|uniref:hypothetical protein n=1 Tax=Mesorhizobium amorphae TaxID=71433 RepID=UPI0017834082|nr:hypothetical protein [Mesorhizobium amorphae]